MAIKVIDLFSGVGGFALAGQLVGGFETVAFCELDPYCQKVITKNFPGIPIFNDVRTLTIDALQERGITEIDAIVGGWPCQDLSNCNPNGKGLAGKRSGLFFEAMRLVRQCRPRYILLENVPALLSKRNGRDMGAVLWELAQSGYAAEWQIVSAAQVGAPHKRERIFIIAYPVSRGHHRGRAGQTSMDGNTETKTAQRSACPIETAGLCKSLPNSYSARLEEWDGSDLAPWTQPTLDGHRWWAVEPRIRRVSNGISHRVDRVKALGNAVLPQCAAIPLKRILELERLD